MILLLGIPSEPPLAMVREAVERIGAKYVLWNQRDAARTRLVDSSMWVGDYRIDLSTIGGVYVRLADHTVLPEFENGDPETLQRVELLHRHLLSWLDVTDALVLNRVDAMVSNASKPYQGQLIAACGLKMPETLVTNDPIAARAFIDRHDGDVIYKSTSAVRSIVQRIGAKDLDRIDQLRNCPTQLQRRIPGRDVRVHVVGSEVFATRVTSTGADYRYAEREGETTSLEAIELDPEMAAVCIRVSEALGLPFCGIDLRVGEEGLFCFEANPSPAFSYYEAHTGQPIADAVARLLAA